MEAEFVPPTWRLQLEVPGGHHYHYQVRTITTTTTITTWSPLSLLCSQFDEFSPVSLVFAVRKCEDGAWVEALLSEKNGVSVFEDTSSPAQCWQWLFHLQTGVKHNKTQNSLHKSQSLIEDDWANSSVRWTPKEEGCLPDWGNEGKLLGRLDKGRHSVPRVCTVVHGSLDTWKSCTSPPSTMELKMMEI